MSAPIARICASPAAWSVPLGLNDCPSADERYLRTHSLSFSPEHEKPGRLVLLDEKTAKLTFEKINSEHG